MTETFPLATRRSASSTIEVLESRITPGVVSFTTPFVKSILSASAVETAASDLVFNVVFDQAVNGVSVDDFHILTSGNAKTNASVGLATVDASHYRVTVSGAHGNGDVALELVDRNTIFGAGGVQQGSIGGEGPANGSFTSPAYHLAQAGPAATIALGTPSTATTGSKDLSWTVTFTKDVTGGVDASDFSLALTGVTAPNPLTVTKVNAKTYTVSVSGLVGTGNVGLNLVDDGSITDTLGNPLQITSLTIATPATLLTDNDGVAAMASGDVDGDGNLDVVTANSKSNAFAQGGVSVLLGKGDGTFQDTKNFSAAFSCVPTGVALADLNGDGKLDIVTSVRSSSAFPLVNVLIGNGDGTFQSATAAGQAFGGATAVMVKDVNHDGRADLVVTNTNFSSIPFVSVMIGKGDGTFLPQADYTVGANPVAVAVEDLTGDGQPDLVTANQGGDSVSVLLNNGNGSFGSASTVTVGSGPQSVVLADLNGDGRLDIVAANHGGKAFSVANGNGDGTFAASNPFNMLALPNAGIVLDVNGDGARDVVTIGDAPPGALSGFGTVFFGDRAGNFPSANNFPSPSTGISSMILADFTKDGRPDVIVGATGSANAWAIKNTGVGDTTGAVYTIIDGPDLTVTAVSNGKTSVAPGDAVTYTIAYDNLGPDDARDVMLSAHLDSNFSFVQSENAGWSLNGSTLTKTITGTYPASAPAGSASLKLHVNSLITAGASSLGLTVSITDDGTHGADANSTNNQASDFDQLTGLTTDVVVTSIDAPKVISPNGTGVYTIHFKNTGNAGASGRFVMPSIADFPLNLAASPGWSFGSGLGYVVSLVAPAGGADQTVQFTAQLASNPSAGPFTFTPAFQVQSSPADAHPENNSASATTSIYHGFYVTAPGVAVAGKYAPPIIRVFDSVTHAEISHFFAYDPKYRDSIRVAVADMNNDGIADIITTTQHNGGKLRVFDGTTNQQMTTGVFTQEIAVFAGKKTGAFVAAGDVNGDGFNDIVVGSALGGGTLKVYSGRPNKPLTRPGLAAIVIPPTAPTVLEEFKPFGDKFKGGVRVAIGDFENSGSVLAKAPLGLGFSTQKDIVVGMGYYGSEVKIYRGATQNVIGDFQVGAKGYIGGVSVAAGDVNGDRITDVIVGRNSGKPSVVEVFDGSEVLNTVKRTTIASEPPRLEPDVVINPFDADPLKPKYKGGVRVAVGDVDNDGIADVITSVGVKGGSQLSFYKIGKNWTPLPASDSVVAYNDYKNVALWVGISATPTQKIIVIDPT